MITIKIHNAENVAIKEKGKLLVAVGKYFGKDVEGIVENKICKKIIRSLTESGVRASVTVID